MTGRFSYNHITSKLEIEGVYLEECVLPAYVSLTWPKHDYSELWTLLINSRSHTHEKLWYNTWMKSVPVHDLDNVLGNALNNSISSITACFGTGKGPCSLSEFQLHADSAASMSKLALLPQRIKCGKMKKEFQNLWKIISQEALQIYQAIPSKFPKYTVLWGCPLLRSR